MDLYFAPLACSLASRIALYEAGLAATFHQVDTTNKSLKGGGDYLSVNPRGQVPALRLGDGEILIENVAILEHLADLNPEAGLAPQEARERTRMRKWLAFVNSELHAGAFSTLFSRTAPDAAKAHARERLLGCLAWLEKELDGREWLTGRFTVADAYLAVVVNWTQAVPIDLRPYPNIAGHRARVFARPATRRAVDEEVTLYRAAA